MVRPGYGKPHPELEAIVAESSPVAESTVSWRQGAMPLHVQAYLGSPPLPDELISSVRCLVRVRDQIVFCQNDGGGHPWPGGRRNEGETLVETAVREVYEETGWHLQVDSLRSLGWLRFTHLARPPQGYEFPHPDFLHVVMGGSSQRRAVGERDEWTDIDEYEQGSELLSVDHARSRPDCDPLSLEFLELISDT